MLECNAEQVKFTNIANEPCRWLRELLVSDSAYVGANTIIGHYLCYFYLRDLRIVLIYQYR